MTNDVQTYLRLLGFRVRDKVTGFVGVVTSCSFDLFGCVQFVVSPPADEQTGKQADSRWFDECRLVKLSEEPVMVQPPCVLREGVFAETVHGPAEKPARG